MVQDGASPLLDATREAIFQEAEAMFGPLSMESVVSDFTLEGARAALTGSLARPGLRGVLALGPAATQAAVETTALEVPVVGLLGAPLSAHGMPDSDPRPLLGRGTGLRFIGDLQHLKGLAPRISQVRVVVTQEALSALPGLDAYLQSASTTHGVTLRALPLADASVDTALDGLDPANTALYLGVPLNPATLNTGALLDAARARRLAVLSGLSTSDVEAGALLSAVPKDGTTLRARQAILGMQALREAEPLQYLRAESPAELALAGASQATTQSLLPLTLNDAVARELGLEPSFALLQSAEVVSESGPGASVSLASAVERALESNRTLRAERMRLEGSDALVRRALGPLLPNVIANAEANWIDTDRAAGPFPPSERQISIGGTASQTIYSARQFGDHKVAKYENAAMTQDYRGARLDLVREVAIRYIEILRTRVVQRVAEQRVRSARANLALAEGRNRAGDVGRDEVFRWRVDLSESQQEAVRASAEVRKADANLNEVLSFAPEHGVRPSERDGAALPMLATDPRLGHYFDSPATLATLRSFAVQRAVDATPELAAARARIEVADRRRKQQLRTLLTPEVSLQAELTRRVWRDGAGSDVVVPGIVIPDNFDWSVGVVANLPLFEGLGQRAAVDEASAATRQAEAEEEALMFAVARQVHNALEEASAAHQSTALATEAAAASRESLILVRDAYARGAVDVIRLVDAQSQAFTTELGARNAYHAFLIAFVAVERLLGQFSFGPAAVSPDAFFQALARPNEPTAHMEPNDASSAQQTH